MRRLSVLLYLLLPQIAWACPVCGGNNEESATAFLIATALLTALPVAVILGAIRWAQKKVEERDREAERLYESRPLTQDGISPARSSASRTFPG